jgi:hypothetical protein
VHYVVSLSPARAALGEYKNYASLRAEIQVRTVLQHAWAAVDHRLRYKSETDAPEHLRRRLFLLSGLFEMADREFSELVLSSERYGHEVEKQIAQRNLNIAVDTQSLRSYIKDSEVARKIIATARVAGYEELNLHKRVNPVLYYDELYYDELDKEIISDSVYYCRLAGITTLGELEDRLSEKLSCYEQYFTLFKKVLSPKEKTDIYVFNIAVLLIVKNHITAKTLLIRNWHHVSAKLIAAFLHELPM